MTAIIKRKPALAADNEDVFNAAWFGALPSAADNRRALQAAIDACAAAGGGIVSVPPGTYVVTEDGSTTVALQMKAKVWLRGAGKYATTIKLADSQNDCHVINLAGSSGTPMAGWAITDIGIDGNRANNTGSGHCIRAQWADDGRVARCYIRNSLYYGIGLQVGTFNRITLESNHISGTGSEGIDIKNLEDNNEDVEILNNLIEGHGQDTGFSAQAGIDARGPCKVLGNTVRDGGAATGLYGIRIREGELLDASGLGGHYTILSNNRVEVNKADGVGMTINARRVVGSANIVRGGQLGIIINQAECILSATTVEGCSGDGFTLNAGGLTTDADKCVLSACLALGCGGDGFQIEGDDSLLIGCGAYNNTAWGFRINSGATANRLAEQHGSGNGSGFITDGGTSTSIDSKP